MSASVSRACDIRFSVIFDDSRLSTYFKKKSTTLCFRAFAAAIGLLWLARGSRRTIIV